MHKSLYMQFGALVQMNSWLRTTHIRSSLLVAYTSINIFRKCQITLKQLGLGIRYGFFFLQKWKHIPGTLFKIKKIDLLPVQLDLMEHGHHFKSKEISFRDMPILNSQSVESKMQ